LHYQIYIYKVCSFTYDSSSETVCNVSAGCVQNNFYIAYKTTDGAETTYSSSETGYAKLLLKMTGEIAVGQVTCSQVSDVGYFLTENDGTTGYISKSYDGDIVEASVETECNALNIGKLVEGDSHAELCLNYHEKDVTLPISVSDTTGNYLLSESTNIFNAATDAKIVVKDDVNSIIVDSTACKYIVIIISNN